MQDLDQGYCPESHRQRSRCDHIGSKVLFAKLGILSSGLCQSWLTMIMNTKSFFPTILVIPVSPFDRHITCRGQAEPQSGQNKARRKRRLDILNGKSAAYELSG